MPEYHVGAGVFGIYAGVLNAKDKTRWQNKSVVTEEAIESVRDWMVSTCCLDEGKTTGGYAWTAKDGSTVELRVTIKEKDDG